MSCVTLALGGWFGYQVQGVTILLKGKSILSGKFGRRAHAAQTHTAVASGSLLERLSWQDRGNALGYRN